VTHDNDDMEQDPEEVQVAEIRADIDETRREMGGTLNELGDRLDPGHLVEQAKENVREATIGRVEETAKGVSDMVMETIKRNPIPAALAGTGLAMLWSNRAQGRQHSAYDGRNSGNGGIAATVAGTASTVGQSVGSAVDTVAGSAQQVSSEVMDRAGETAQQVSWKLESFMRASPLAMGAIAVGAGAVIGSLVPETSKEREMLGDASRQVSSAVRDTVDEVTSKAEETLDRAEAEISTPA
jgi:hypothetical protein